MRATTRARQTRGILLPFNRSFINPLLGWTSHYVMGAGKRICPRMLYTTRHRPRDVNDDLTGTAGRSLAITLSTLLPVIISYKSVYHAFNCWNRQ